MQQMWQLVLDIGSIFYPDDIFLVALCYFPYFIFIGFNTCTFCGGFYSLYSIETL